MTLLRMESVAPLGRHFRARYPLEPGTHITGVFQCGAPVNAEAEPIQRLVVPEAAKTRGYVPNFARTTEMNGSWLSGSDWLQHEAMTYDEATEENCRYFGSRRKTRCR